MYNFVQPVRYRMQEPCSNVPVRPAATVSADSHVTATPTAAAMAPGENNLPAPHDAATAAAAASDVDASAADPSQLVYEEPGWWSPGMEMMGAAGYGSSYDGTLSYGGQDFYFQ